MHIYFHASCDKQHNSFFFYKSYLILIFNLISILSNLVPELIILLQNIIMCARCLFLILLQISQCVPVLVFGTFANIMMYAGASL